MNITKIIKIYFVFVLIISSISVFSYSDGFENYLLSVLHSGKSSMSTDFMAPLISFDYKGNEYFSEKGSDSLVNFVIINDVESSFVVPGSEDVEMMGFLIKAGDDPIVLKELKLKIVGIEPEMIDSAYLMDGDQKIRVGTKNDEYISFSRIDKLVKPNKYKILRLYVSLNEETHSGERFRMDIENPEDIILFAGKDIYKIGGYYPIKGKYLSVVNR